MKGSHSQRQQFASDNYSGICPEALQYMEKVNTGHESPYGDDRWTAEACDLFRELFEAPCEVFFVFNGTAANSLAIPRMLRQSGLFGVTLTSKMVSFPRVSVPSTSRPVIVSIWAISSGGGLNSMKSLSHV